MVLDLVKLRNSKFKKFCIELFEKTFFNDQLCLGVYADNDFIEIDSVWNAFVKDGASDDSKI